MKNPTLRLLSVFSVTLSLAALAGPKYGPNASPLSKKTNLAYFQKNPAPDFWALIPFYVGQPTGSACGATNLTWIMNAVRAQGNQGSDDKVLSVEDFVKKYTDKDYENAIFQKGPFERKNVTNDNMSRLLVLASEKLNVKETGTKSVVHEVDYNHLDKSKQEFIKNLKENEKSANDFIVISFMQGTLTGDPEGGPHVATIGAYDESKNLVLLMDPDREYYEPYWSPVDKVFESVADKKSDGKHSGWIHFTVRDAASASKNTPH